MKIERYYAKEENGRFYLMDRNFSDHLPIAAEKSLEIAQAQAKKFNDQEAENAVFNQWDKNNIKEGLSIAKENDLDIVWLCVLYSKINQK